jgi:uncharacterized protein (TIRG00374 family)
VRAVRSDWLAVAVALQLGSFACYPVIWWVVVRRGWRSLPLRRVLPLTWLKVLVDRVVPAGGVSGSAAVVRGLVRRGVPQPVAMAAVLADFVAYFCGYSLAVLATLALFWMGGHVDWVFGALAVPFAVVAVAVPLAIVRLCAPERGRLARWLVRWRPLERLLCSFEQAPVPLVTGAATLIPAAALRLLVFVLNGATLAALLLALDHGMAGGAPFAAVVMGSLATTVLPVPGGVGSYEAASVGTLVMMGVPAEPALAATLLLRGLSFWAPILPGLLVVRGELQRVSTSESNSVPTPSMACKVSASPATVMYRK